MYYIKPNSYETYLRKPTNSQVQKHNTWHLRIATVCHRGSERRRKAKKLFSCPSIFVHASSSLSFLTAAGGRRGRRRGHKNRLPSISLGQKRVAETFSGGLRHPSIQARQSLISCPLMRGFKRPISFPGGKTQPGGRKRRNHGTAATSFAREALMMLFSCLFLQMNLCPYVHLSLLTDQSGRHRVKQA